jgi:hypothetical protein
MNEWHDNSNFQSSASTIYFCFETTDDVSPHANFWVKYRYEAPGWLGGKLMKENHSTGHWTLGVLIIGSCWKNDLWLLRPKLFQGVLAQAKYGDKFFWEEKFLQPMGRPKQALKVPCFFSFSPGFPMCSHYVTFKFPMGTSQYVPQVPNVFPNMFSIAPHFYPICFGNVVLLSPIYLVPREGTLYFKLETSFLVAFIFHFHLSDGPNKLACCKKNKLNLGGTSSS